MSAWKKLAIGLALFFAVPYCVPAPAVDIPDVIRAASDQVRPQPDYRFTSDGCSGGMSLLWWLATGQGPPWQPCCVTHDFAYWRGGTSAERQEADAHLLQCVDASGHPIWAWIMWAGVRLGGTPYAPTEWRWGYGWHYWRIFAHAREYES